MSFFRSTSSPNNGVPWRLAVAVACGIIVGVLNSARVAAGTLEIRLKDHREAIGDFDKLVVTVDKVLITPKAGLKFWQMGWKSLSLVREKVDLTNYRGKRSATIVRREMAQGTFEGVHLKIKSVEGILKKRGKAVPVKSFVGPIELPFAVGHEGETVIVLDLVVMDVSDHAPSGYELHLRGYELYNNGKLIDKIPPG